MFEGEGPESRIERRLDEERGRKRGCCGQNLVEPNRGMALKKRTGSHGSVELQTKKTKIKS